MKHEGCSWVFCFGNTFVNFLDFNLYPCIQKDLDPKKRPGAGPEGYAALKAHPFFHGIEWSQLWKLPSPPVATSEEQVRFQSRFWLATT